MVRQGFCACSSCHAPKFDFQNCLFKTMLGRALPVCCPPVHQPAGVTTRTGEIAEFAKKVKSGQIRAVDVAADQIAIEGAPFWLCKVVDDAFQASSDVVFAGDHFPEGFYLVKIKWFQFVRLGSGGERCYRLVEEERMLSVHSLIRCDVKLAPPVEKLGRGRHGPLFTLTSSQCSSVMSCAEIQDDGSD